MGWTDRSPRAGLTRSRLDSIGSAATQEFAVGSVQAFFDLGRLVVDVGEGDELPELYQLHRPAELAFAPDVYEAVERLGQRVVQAEVEVGIQAFEVVGLVGAY